jgi:hypothetical protein
MRICDIGATKVYGSVPLGVTFLLTAAIAVIAAAPMYLLPSQGGPMGWALPGFAAILTLGALRSSIPTKFRPVWALVGFPLMIGLTLFTVSVLRESSPSSGGSNGGSSVFWMFPMLFLGLGLRKNTCSMSCKAQKTTFAAFASVLLIPAIIAGWLVWDAVQTGQGRVYAALPSIFEFAGIWTGAMLLVGVALVATMGLRRRPEDDAADPAFIA